MLERRHVRLLWLLAVSCFTEGYDFALLTVALPQVRDAFGLSHAQADLWIALLYLGALPALVFGRHADRHGRRRVLLAAMVGYLLAAAATAGSPSIGVFVACQFVARCFIATQVAVAWTMAAEDLPAERRGFGFGVLALASALGSGTASIVQASVLGPFDASWRWLYLLTLPFLLVVARLRAALPESERYLRVEREPSTDSPRVLFEPRFRTTLLVLCAAIVLVNLTTEATVFAIDFLETERGLGTSTANLLLVAAGACALPALVVSGRLSDRIGRRRVCIAGLLVQAAGLVTFFVVARGVAALGVALCVTYLGLFTAWTTGTAFAVELFPTSVRAVASAAAAMAKLLGQSASFALAAALITATGRIDVSVTLLVSGLLLGAVLVARYVPETSRRELADRAVEPAPAAPL